MTSVLQDWVMELPLRAQGTLLTGVRGCDPAPKTPGAIDERYGCSTGECSAERSLSAFLRYCILVPADPREVDVPGAWFQSRPPGDWKPSAFGHYPLHWYSHLMHSFEVVGYCHPSGRMEEFTSFSDAHEWTTPAGWAPKDGLGGYTEAARALSIYFRLAHGLHLEPESRAQMLERLTEDRIANDTVVS